jgi:hypothetical protein
MKRRNTLWASELHLTTRADVLQVMASPMKVNATHLDYDASAGAWSRARDVIAGEDAVKAAGERYLPRLEEQGDDDYASYRARALFFNATARTADGFVGLIFRRAPLIRLPASSASAGQALAQFNNDADLLGTSLYGYAKNVVTEVIAVGRAGTLVDWESEGEHRAYATLYRAESIRNWRTQRVNGRCVLTYVALSENADNGEFSALATEADTAPVERIRVLKLVPGKNDGDRQRKPVFCQVEVWQRSAKTTGRDKTEWVLVESKTPQRRGKPLPLIPFVFHGPRHSRAEVDKLPLTDILAVNLDHYRLDADYKHGVHYTALPTAWVSGFDKAATLLIGSRTAWVSEQPGATAGFLEFTGQGLSTFERAMDRDEQRMATLGSRVLAGEKKVGETAEALELRQSGENSILSSIATSVSESLTQVLRWAYWWNSTEATPEAVTDEQVLLELNTDFSTKGMTAPELAAVVKSWQAGALSLDTMQELFRKGEILPDGRTNQEEQALLGQESGKQKVESKNQMADGGS